MKPIYINKNKVAILLSCYNGERYLHELIHSIIHQSYQDYTLYIRDDGSTDSTFSILQTYECDNIVLFPQSRNLGSKHSFLYMMSNVDSDYYMFCDQDDVWMNSKIEKSLRTIQEIEHRNPLKPTIVHTDLRLVDGNMNVIANSYWDYNKVPFEINHKYEYLCHFNDITGCAMIFNKIAREFSLPYASIDMPRHLYHDSLIGLIVAKNYGVIYPLKEQKIWFRRHDSNETNPLIHNKSVFYQPFRIMSWLIEQYKRFQFYNQIKPDLFTTFIYNKILVSIKIKQWKKKHV